MNVFEIFLHFVFLNVLTFKCLNVTLKVKCFIFIWQIIYDCSLFFFLFCWSSVEPVVMILNLSSVTPDGRASDLVKPLPLDHRK